MRIFTVALVALMFAMGATARPKDEAPQYKTAEAKHFTTAEGVELSPAFVDYFYAELRNEMTKAKLVKEVIGEGEAVEDADAPKSLVISGTVTEYTGHGGAGWTRTTDNAIMSRALYHLSYGTARA